LPDDLVSIVIPAYNPVSYLLEAIASASAQTHRNVEIVLVNDGTDKPESLAVLAQAARLVGTYLEQPNRGLGAARNAGIRAAHGEFVVPLDADDVIEPAYIAECLTALDDSDAAFAYTDFRVFGTATYQERPGEYNLYRLLDRNYLTYAGLIRKHDWEKSGGYDESLKCLGYEDWEFWLRLGARNRFGRYVPKSLFRYRKHGASLYDYALARHREFVAYIRSLHPELYEYENRARVKARWSPAVSIIALEPPSNQTIQDIQVIAPGESPLAPAVLDATRGSLDPEAAELSALAAWSGRADAQPLRPSAGSRLHRNLLNAELLSLRSWTHHPARSLARLVPLRAKERINKTLRRRVFDLSFYLQFQPNSVLLGDMLVDPLVYYPKPAHGRKRVALVTTHLGPGGAEQVLYDIASTLNPGRFESLLLATQSRDDRWLTKWRGRVERTYDLARVVPPERMTAALYSMISNWRCDYLLLQNSLYGYAALPHLKKLLPDIKIFDLVHYLDEGWDQIASTAEVGSYIDCRVALAESVRDRLLAMGTPQSKILLVRNGVDLERYHPSPMNGASSVKQILFAARLERRKQPLLLADIARELSNLRPAGDFRFVIAGDGPEKERIERRVHKLGLDAVFDFRGQVDDLAPLFAACDIVILPSRSEGVPLVILEALASGRCVIASKVGSIPEVLDSSCGILIEHFDAAGEFARAIHSLLDQRELREKMGAAGRRKVEANHDIRKTHEALMRVFDQSSAVDQGSAVSVSSTNRSTAME
jgi:glycosyltransferase involved in cell wall biosynthesis/GT2 family glycosyltransferase